MGLLEWLKWTGKIHHGDNYLWSMMKKSSVYRMQSLCIFRFCVMSWKVIRIQHQILFGTKSWAGPDGFITIQNFGHNWRRADGIRVEYFPEFTTLQFIGKVQEIMTKIGDPSQFKGRDYLHVDVQWQLYGGSEGQWTGNALQTPTLETLFAKRFPAGRWTFVGLGSEKKWYSTYIERRTRRHWTESLNLWWSNSEKADTQFSSHESIVPRNAQKQTRWKIIIALLCLGDAVENLTHCQASKIVDNNTYTFDWSSLHKKIYCKSKKNEWKGSHNKIAW